MPAQHPHQRKICQVHAQEAGAHPISFGFLFAPNASDQTEEKYGPCKLEQASCASPPSHTAKAQNRTENTPGGYRLTPGIKLSITALIPQEDKGVGGIRWLSIT